jgi:hypothetical protein
VYLLPLLWQVLAVAKGSRSVVTDKRGHFRHWQFVLVPKHTPSATWIPNGKSQLAAVDQGHHSRYVHMN